MFNSLRTAFRPFQNNNIYLVPASLGDLVIFAFGSDGTLDNPACHEESEIATACGFNSANHFSRHFKERYGDTPFGVRGKKVTST